MARRRSRRVIARFWRVEDRHSAARYDGLDIVALSLGWVNMEAHDGNERRILYRALEDHLDWSNRNPTPFISVYAHRDAAYADAERRVREDRMDVVVTEIVIREEDIGGQRSRIRFRQVRKLARENHLRIPPRAWHNSKEEFVFLHRIPGRTIVQRTHWD